MAGNENEGWISKYGAWVALIMWIATFVYYGIIEGNTAKNKIAALEQWKLEATIRMDNLDRDKVSKETFIMIMNGQIEIKGLIDKTNTLVLDHILKGK